MDATKYKILEVIIIEMCLQPTALARLRDAKETAKNEKIKEIISRILQVARVLP